MKETNSEAVLNCNGTVVLFLGRELGSGVDAHTVAFQDSEDLVACRWC